MVEFKLVPPQIPNLGSRGTFLARLESLIGDRRRGLIWAVGVFLYLWLASLVVGLSWWRSGIFCLVLLALGVYGLRLYFRLLRTVSEEPLSRGILAVVAGVTGFLWMMILILPTIAWLAILLYGLASIPAWLTR